MLKDILGLLRTKFINIRFPCQNVYIDKLDLFNEYNDIYHKITKMKPIDINTSTGISFEVENTSTVIDTSKFPKQTDLASLKSKLDKIEADELENIPIDLRNLSNVVKNDVVETTAYDTLVKKGNTIDFEQQNLEKMINKVWIQKINKNKL